MAIRNNSCFLSSQDFIRFNYDVLSVNDPYFWESKVTEFPTGIRKYFYDYKPITVFLIPNPDIMIFPLKILKKLVGIEIELCGEKFLMIWIYCPQVKNFVRI
ncbi:hypothetical protein AVEN_104482-1 [Araneus ventricosus]|uniref:Uncharacterized protein n=1 Tax=Araneus ventricosus TaxID=182803 RepID=A0A4Y2R0W4_ARAVE|nr:hypothetical protein AVEN_104482-1 [Araneus ventricosus]